ncbi:ABC transporter substrate-binding protein [Nocardiopsis ansamitocini]|uniref:Thiamine pyrimidine synthase n=1 Tax=Nocardiopsis ansamitocini TaxID=1670832 RepID=A0A9W6P807_9ACTN|nr:ABC transporter substrate-binding protein [Nocardiopsis ansamitocini]GLU48744.1 hypothetical protein Nans01_30950 [Nocardiopsis ansamitocini]
MSTPNARHIPCRRSLPRALAAAALATGLAACGTAGGAAGTTDADGNREVRVALDWNSYVAYHAPLVIAQEKGFFDEEGITTTLQLTAGSKDGVLAVGTGKADIGWVDLSTAAASMMSGLPVVSVATVQHKNATGLTVLEDSAIQEPDDVRGLRIGSTPGGSDSTLVPAFLSANDIPEDDVTIVNLPANGKIAALLAGKVDAISGQGYYAQSAIADAGEEARTLLYSDAGADVLDHGFVAGNALTDGDGETITAFLRAYRKGLDYTEENQEEACEVLAAESDGTLTESFCTSQLSGWLELVPAADTDAPWGSNSESAWADTIDILQTYGGVEGDTAVADMYTNDFLPDGQ